MSQRFQNYYTKALWITWIGAILNVLLTLMKFAAGFWGHSRALIADGIESSVDIISNLAVIFSLHLSRKPRDENHHFGHQKAESLASSVISILMFITAFYMISDSVKVIERNDNYTPESIAIIVSLLVIVLKEALALWTLKVGKQIQSLLVIANGRHYQVDVLTTIGTLVAVIVARLKFPVFDTLAQLIIAAFIVVSAGKILWNATNELLDHAPPMDFINKVKECVMGVEGILEVRSVRVRPIGSFYSVEVEVAVNGNLTVKSGHDIASKTEMALADDISSIAEVVVHVEPHILSAPKNDIQQT